MVGTKESVEGSSLFDVSNGPALRHWEITPFVISLYDEIPKVSVKYCSLDAAAYCLNTRMSLWVYCRNVRVRNFALEIPDVFVCNKTHDDLLP